MKEKVRKILDIPKQNALSLPLKVDVNNVNMGECEEKQNYTSIIKQLRETLNVLKDYPYIEDILDVKGAQQFLNVLEETEFAVIPNFKKINFVKIRRIIKKHERELNKWWRAIYKLPYMELSDADLEGDELFWGKYPSDLEEVREENTSSNLSFYTNNRATVELLSNEGELEEFKGTWVEVYKRLAKHLNDLKNPPIPKLPKRLEKSRKYYPK